MACEPCSSSSRFCESDTYPISAIHHRLMLTRLLHWKPIFSIFSSDPIGARDSSLIVPGAYLEVVITKA